LREAAEYVPADAFLFGEPERGRQPIDARAALGGVLAVAIPEESAGDDEFGEGGAVAIAGGVGNLVAQRRQFGILDLGRRHNRHRLIRLECRLRPLLGRRRDGAYRRREQQHGNGRTTKERHDNIPAKSDVNGRRSLARCVIAGRVAISRAARNNCLKPSTGKSVSCPQYRPIFCRSHC
jgi:hypothetical protein